MSTEVIHNQGCKPILKCTDLRPGWRLLGYWHAPHLDFIYTIYADDKGDTHRASSIKRWGTVRIAILPDEMWSESDLLTYLITRKV